MKNIAIIGAGNIGSRHFQALKSVSTPLKIYIVDPNSESIIIAKKRYHSINSGEKIHKIEFYNSIKKFNEKIDLAIIATSSDVRRIVIENLLELNEVDNLLLEKILFQRAEDYYAVKELFEKKKCNAWVNCTRRLFPIYRDKIKNWFNNKKIAFNVSGSNWGLISNTIHFVDIMAFILDCNEFSINTEHLNNKISKKSRKGVIELTGVLQINFKDGSFGNFINYPSGNLPIFIDLTSEDCKCLIRQEEEKAWMWDKNKQEWEEIKAEFIHTSKLTTRITETILSNNDCSLITYEDSMKLHLKILEPILEFLNNKLKLEYNYYPFT